MMVGGMCSLLLYGTGICHSAFTELFINIFCVCPFLFSFFFFNLESVN